VEDEDGVAALERLGPGDAAALLVGAAVPDDHAAAAGSALEIIVGELVILDLERHPLHRRSIEGPLGTATTSSPRRPRSRRSQWCAVAACSWTTKTPRRRRGSQTARDPPASPPRPRPRQPRRRGARCGGNRVASRPPPASPRRGPARCRRPRSAPSRRRRAVPPAAESRSGTRCPGRSREPVARTAASAFALAIADEGMRYPCRERGCLFSTMVEKRQPDGRVVEKGQPHRGVADSYVGY